MFISQNTSSSSWPVVSAVESDTFVALLLIEVTMVLSQGRGEREREGEDGGRIFQRSSARWTLGRIFEVYLGEGVAGTNRCKRRNQKRYTSAALCETCGPFNDLTWVVGLILLLFPSSFHERLDAV